jgi:ribosome biogenesis GTPase / thiamine phosphate phosphatase
LLNTDGLFEWGWNDEWTVAYTAVPRNPQLHCPGRILSQREDTFTVATSNGLKWAHPAGVLFHQKSTRERPGVGDWVVLESFDCPVTDEENSVNVTHSVIEVLPRRSCFLREAPGGRGEAQVVATNVDQVFVVNPADDVNLNRIERFAAAIASAGAKPGVVLSKGDLVPPEQLRLALQEISKVMVDLEVVTCSHLPNKLDEAKESLFKVLRPGETYALVGASGVGKSTLVNALMGESVQETKDVREGDHKGRHVTTFRQLFSLPNGSLIMDTPGVREFAMWSQGDGISQVFSDIENLEQECRFADCSHDTEPGCAVTQAIEEGQLSRRRLANWRGLVQESTENEERRENREARQERSKYRRKVKRDNRFSKR